MDGRQWHSHPYPQSKAQGSTSTLRQPHHFHVCIKRPSFIKFSIAGGLWTVRFFSCKMQNEASKCLSLHKLIQKTMVSYKELGLVNTREMFAKAVDGGYAIPAFNFNNMEQLQAIIMAAAETKSPVSRSRIPSHTVTNIPFMLFLYNWRLTSSST